MRTLDGTRLAPGEAASLPKSGSSTGVPLGVVAKSGSAMGLGVVFGFGLTGLGDACGVYCPSTTVTPPPVTVRDVVADAVVPEVVPSPEAPPNETRYPVPGCRFGNE